MTTEFENIEQYYDSKFSWRKDRQIYNLRELSEITNSYDIDPFEIFHSLFRPAGEDSKDALRWSILMLSHEASECYIFGKFQSCILTCGAILERTLKLEYYELHSEMPDEGKWSLGKCIYDLDWKGTRITSDILELAQKILEPRNSRAHALLEHSDPRLSIMGGRERGIEIVDSSKYLIEPFRGDAKKTIEITFNILAKLYK